MNTLKKVEKTIEKYGMLSIGDTVVVGVSGGADSVMLLHVLYQLKEKYNLTLLVAHVNHKIRKGEAERDAEFVKNLCEKWNIPFYLREVDIKAKAKEFKMSEEEMGRQVRYNFFKELANPSGKIATAHNANDNVETVLMRFMRGTGVKGLSGISHKTRNIIRPILDISREEIEKYLEENGLTHITDSTNLVPIYTRNKIRLNLIPEIQRDFNNNFVETMTSNIRTFSEDSDYFEVEVEKQFNQIVSYNRDDVAFICKANKLFNLHPAIAKRLIRKIIETLKGTTSIDISAVKVEEIWNMSRQVGTIITLNEGYQVRMGYDVVYFEKIKTVNKNMSIYSISMPELIVMNYTTLMGIDMDLSVFDVDSFYIDNKPDCFYLPYDNYADKNLTVRTRREGDVIRVEDGVHKKLNKFMVDKKIPSDIRDRLWLLCDGNEVLCIFDYFATRFSKRNGRFIKIVKEN